MQEIQILFPDPFMARLRAVAREQDRPMSDLVRRDDESASDAAHEIPPA